MVPHGAGETIPDKRTASWCLPERANRGAGGAFGVVVAWHDLRGLALRGSTTNCRDGEAHRVQTKPSYGLRMLAPLSSDRCGAGQSRLGCVSSNRLGTFDAAVGGGDPGKAACACEALAGRWWWNSRCRLCYSLPWARPIQLPHHHRAPQVREAMSPAPAGSASWDRFPSPA